MKLTYRHVGKYTGSNFTLDEVVLSLTAQKDILKSGVFFLSDLDKDFEIDAIKFYVERLETHSLLWDILVEIYGTYQAKISDEIVHGVEGMFGIDIPSEYEPLVGLASLAVTYVVVRYAYDRAMGGSASESASGVHIRGDCNVVIQNIAEIVNQSPDVVANALERSLPPTKRRALLPKVADFLRPAKSRPGERISIVGVPDITPEVLAEFPSDAQLAAVDDNLNVDVDGAKVEIRATDRDKRKTGWSGIIIGDERFSKRLPMDIYPTINSDELASHRFIHGDLIVQCERKADGTLLPKRIHLLSYRPSNG